MNSNSNGTTGFLGKMCFDGRFGKNCWPTFTLYSCRFPEVVNFKAR